MTETVKKVGFQTYEPGVEVRFVPEEEALKKCFDFGQQIAAKTQT